MICFDSDPVMIAAYRLQAKDEFKHLGYIIRNKMRSHAEIMEQMQKADKGSMEYLALARRVAELEQKISGMEHRRTAIAEMLNG